MEAVTRRIALIAQDLAGAGQLRTVLLWQEFLAVGFPPRSSLRNARTFSLNGNGSSRVVACSADTILEAMSRCLRHNRRFLMAMDRPLFLLQQRIHPWLQEAQALELLRRLRNSYHRADSHFKL